MKDARRPGLAALVLHDLDEVRGPKVAEVTSLGQAIRLPRVQHEASDVMGDLFDRGVGRQPPREAVSIEGPHRLYPLQSEEGLQTRIQGGTGQGLLRVAELPRGSREGGGELHLVERLVVRVDGDDAVKVGEPEARGAQCGFDVPDHASHLAPRPALAAANALEDSRQLLRLGRVAIALADAEHGRKQRESRVVLACQHDAGGVVLPLLGGRGETAVAAEEVLIAAVQSAATLAEREVEGLAEEPGRFQCSACAPVPPLSLRVLQALDTLAEARSVGTVMARLDVRLRRSLPLL